MTEATRLERRRIAQDERQAQAIEAPKAMADYIKSRDAVLEQMVELRAQRLRRKIGDNHGRK